MICLGTLGVAFKGYFKKTDEASVTPQTTATIAAATIMDNLTLRQMSDAMAHLSNDVVSLERCIADQNHWLRTKIDTEREVCKHLARLADVMERSHNDMSQRQARERDDLDTRQARERGD